MNNLDALVEAGVITPGGVERLTDADRETIASLSGDEVGSIISITDKMGRAFFDKMCSHVAFF